MNRESYFPLSNFNKYETGHDKRALFIPFKDNLKIRMTTRGDMPFSERDTSHNYINLIKRMPLLLCIEMRVHPGFNSTLAFNSTKRLLDNVNNNKIVSTIDAGSDSLLQICHANNTPRVSKTWDTDRTAFSQKIRDDFILDNPTFPIHGVSRWWQFLRWARTKNFMRSCNIFQYIWFSIFWH